jgi:sugar phosphate isomerase/epimerase
MRIGLVSAALTGLDFEPGLALVRDCGFDSIEIACAGFQTDLTFGDPEVLARDPSKRSRWMEAVQRHDLSISALALHGEPLSPDRSLGERYRRQFRAACELAGAVGVSRLTLLAGLPEGAPGDTAPCWIASAFPPRNREILEWQWSERVIPYWREAASIADAHGCRLCFEMHPGDVLYNPEALLRLRADLGPTIGCNFDPSHLFWQGIEPVEAMFALSDVIYHVHVKDTSIAEHNVRVNGFLDSKPFTDLRARAWCFRTVGFGHDASFWGRFVSALRVIGYDDVLSIEHEDDFIGVEEGLRKGIAFLKPIVFGQAPRPLD